LRKRKYTGYTLTVIGLLLSTLAYFLFGYPGWSFWLLIVLPLAILLLAMFVETVIIISGFVLSFSSLLFLFLGGSELIPSFRYLMVSTSCLFLTGSALLLLDSVNSKNEK
jgi:hypothetical protein